MRLEQLKSDLQYLLNQLKSHAKKGDWGAFDFTINDVMIIKNQIMEIK